MACSESRETKFQLPTPISANLCAVGGLEGRGGRLLSVLGARRVHGDVGATVDKKEATETMAIDRQRSLGGSSDRRDCRSAGSYDRLPALEFPWVDGVR